MKIFRDVTWKRHSTLWCGTSRAASVCTRGGVHDAGVCEGGAEGPGRRAAVVLPRGVQDGRQADRAAPLPGRTRRVRLAFLS